MSRDKIQQLAKDFGRKIVIPTFFSNFSPFSFFISNLFLTFANASWRKLSFIGSEGCVVNDIVG